MYSEGEVYALCGLKFRGRRSGACEGPGAGGVFFQAEDGIRDHCVTGVQTCALPIVECGASRYRPLHICHEVEVQRLVAYRRQQCGVAERERRVVFYDAHVVATEGCCMSAHGQPQEIVFRLALLCGSVAVATMLSMRYKKIFLILVFYGESVLVLQLWTVPW